MINKNCLLLLVLTLFVGTTAHADIVVDGTAYHADTLVHRQVGPGMINTIVHMPDFPLNVYVVSVDLNNPNNRVETTFAKGILGKSELLSDAVVRNRTATKRPIAACNANFWVVGGNAPLSYFQQGTPMGGVVRNDTTVVNDNNTYDVWNRGPYSTGVAAITNDKSLMFGRMMWSGDITSDKLEQPLVYHNVNRRAVNGEICLWGPPYSRTRAFEDDWVAYATRGNNHSDNYYLTFVEGSDWKVNAPMTLTVSKIVPDADRQTLGAFDACLTVTGDANKQTMAALAVGDTITLISGWRVLDDGVSPEFPEIENLVTGNAAIMHNGELTSRNYDEDYNTISYSRTCYGASADGKHLYLLVIDKSVSPIYGKSHGCSSAKACQILKQMCPDVSEIINMDAGGSAEMLVRGKIINTTMEGTPRGVATGWMVEAVGEEDNELASIAFDKHRIDMASYASVTPRILGYNRIGELIDEDVKGFTLSCDEAIGTASGNVFVAAGQDATGTLTATLGDMTATVPVHVMSAEPGLVLKPIVIDYRQYAIEVSAQIVDNTYFFDPASLQWNVDDSGIAVIEDGVLRGLQQGSTGLECVVGPHVDNTEVLVQLSPSAYLYEDWTGWTLKGAGAKNIKIDEATGNVTFDYSTNRSPYLQMLKDLTFYGLPDTVGLVFNCSLPVDYVQIDTRNRFNTTSHYIKYYPEDGSEVFTPGVDHRIKLNLDDMGGADYVGTYPLMIKLIKFSINKDSGSGNNQYLALKSFYCHYPRTSIKRPSGDVNGDGEVNVADVNAIIDVVLRDIVNNNADVNGDGEVNIADINTVIDLILSN